MKKAIILEHVAFEGPSRLTALLEQSQCQLDIRALHLGDPVPEALAPGELLIVMGGPMGVSDLNRPQWSFLRREVALLSWCIERDWPVLGICLGAQLLAHAAGARVYPMKHGDERKYEVGWGPIQFHGAPGDPVFAGIPDEMPVLHWHGDTFDLPAGAELLASSVACRNQAFRVGRRLFGLQFHCETSAGDVETWLAEDEAFITKANGPGAVAAIRRDTVQNMAQQRVIGDHLLGNILDAMSAR